MKVSYFPGCTLRTKAKKLDLYARRCAEKLGVELCEIKDWQCCGGVFVSAKDEIASKLPSVRALVAARDAGQPLVTVSYHGQRFCGQAFLFRKAALFQPSP